MAMTDRLPVLVDPHFRRMDEIFAPEDRARLGALAEVRWGRDEPMPLDEARAALADASAVVCSGWRYGDAALERAEKLRAILDVSGGFPRELDYERCFARGVRVLSCAPAFGPQVAEMALGMALACSRQIVEGDRAMREGSERWLHEGNQSTFQLYGQPVGLIGYGGLARSLRPLLAPFGCALSVYDPWLSAGYLRSQGVEPAALEELMASSRVIFVLAAPTAENRALLGRELLERVRPDAVLVLISRAHVVDFDALTELVLAGRFRAAIDVFPTEPLPPDDPIRSAPGAVLSAHRAGSVAEGLREIGRMVVDDLEAVLAGMPPQRLQRAEPELAPRYGNNRVPPPR
jgi:phosphoglycerate dehydrogenase-like enzyme